MAFGIKSGTDLIRANDGYVIGLVRSTSFGRKRVAFDDNSFFCKSSKRHCYQDSFLPDEKSALEALPQDILTVIAKQTHFAYSTPTKTVGFQRGDIFGDFDEGEGPNAPKQLRVPRSRLCKKKLAGISVALFFSDEKDYWLRKDAFMEMETEDT